MSYRTEPNCERDIVVGKLSQWGDMPARAGIGEPNNHRLVMEC